MNNRNVPLTEAQQKSMKQKVDLMLSLAGSDPATMLTVLSYALVFGAAKCQVTPMSVIAVLAQMFDDIEGDDDDEDGEDE